MAGFGRQDSLISLLSRGERFRIDLAEGGLAEQAFMALNRQLAARGLFVKAGTMIDAMLVEADLKRPPLEVSEVCLRDPDAGFTKRGQRSFFGYKAHLAVDQSSDLIRRDPDRGRRRRQPRRRRPDLR